MRAEQAQLAIRSENFPALLHAVIATIAQSWR
jgi:hypothetical protein